MRRLRFAPVTSGYVACVVLLTVAGRAPSAHADLAAFVAVLLTMPAALVLPVLALVPDHLGWYALPLVALLNAFVLRRLHRVLPRDPAAAGVEDRLHSALVSTGLAVTPMAQAGPRRTRSLLLRDVPIAYPQLMGVYGDLWRESGLRVEQMSEPPALRAYDGEGYEFSLRAGPGYFGDAILTVAAPPVRRRAVVAGLAVGAVPCVAAALSEAYPVLLLTGCGALVGGLACLAAPRTRGFGRGLLAGGVPALVVLLLYGPA